MSLRVEQVVLLGRDLQQPVRSQVILLILIMIMILIMIITIVIIIIMHTLRFNCKIVFRPG